MRLIIFLVFLSGGILLFSKEAIINLCKNAGLSDISSGLVGGFGGGVAQVSVLGPCTYLVTASVTGEEKEKKGKEEKRKENEWKEKKGKGKGKKGKGKGKKRIEKKRKE